MRPVRLPNTATLALAGFFTLHPTPRPAPRASDLPVDPRMYAGLRWRNIGPFRGGRIAAVTGVIGQPAVFYAGLPAGGVWKTTSAGEVWYPVFDGVKDVASVGAIEVAPSDPDVIYAGTGDIVTGGAINEGNGVYKSSDAGRTWQHVGLDATKQIPSILVDPHDPNLVLVAAQGNMHQKSDARGVFRSTDGGKTWTRTLFVADSIGIQRLGRAFDVPNVIYAVSANHYSSGPPRFSPEGPSGTMLYRSTDEGVTWQPVTTTPRMNGRAMVAVAMNTRAQRLYLTTNTGFYRSDDAGATWRQMDAQDERIHNGQGGYNCGVYVDPQNPDVVYVLNTSSYVSRDGGNTFTGFKGAPGGDDPQQLWIDPTNGKRIFMGMDQGATISFDGGHTWSSWYNQSTEQVYHISVDNSFPYFVYATQQDAGAIRTRSRGNFGEITPLDWNPVAGWEWGTIIADPLDPNTVYASGNGIVKITYPSEQWINVSPAADPDARLRVSQSQPILFSPTNPHELLAGFQYVMSTTDGGAHWTKISPDLGARFGTPTPPRGASVIGVVPNGTIESMSASTMAAGTIWVGTTNGLVFVTRDHGKSWQNVSITDVPDGNTADVLSVDASHTDPGGAYVAIGHYRTGDYHTYFYRTHDYGKTWTKIVNGLPTDQPNGSFARVVRADPVKAGLLFAGTESGMYVSFDDGDHWQTLQLDLPTTSYRDIAFKGNDLVVGTYGRGIYVLDGYTMLRQLSPGVVQASAEPARLFAPDTAVRVRRNVNADTPFPPEVPHALNPPDGAIIYYYLAQKPAGDITLDVLDASGNVVRHMSSAPITPVEEASHPPEPNFWIATPEPLPTDVGTNRVNWDLRYDAPPAFNHTFEINANPGQTPPSPEGLLAAPGTYMLRLTVDGHSYNQPLVVRNDPRSPASTAAVVAQVEFLRAIDSAIRASWSGYHVADSLGIAAHAIGTPTPPSDVAAALSNFDVMLDSLRGSARAPRGIRRFGANPRPTFESVNSALVTQLEAEDNGDMAPTDATRAAFAASCKDLGDVDARLNALLTKGVPALNAVFGRAGLHALPLTKEIIPPRC